MPAAGPPPGNVALALNSLADWHLKYGQDREAARQDLEKIIELFPDSEMSARAAQRIAHLANPDFLLEVQAHEPKEFRWRRARRMSDCRPAGRRRERPKPTRRSRCSST